MRAVLTRCASAAVSVVDDATGEETVVGRLERPGLLALIGVTGTDDAAEVAKIARKIAGLRILEGERSATDLGAPVLIVSQFTLYGDARKGRRPSWVAASPREHAEPLVELLVELLRAEGLEVATGRFGAHMRVSSVNDGPFTILLDSAEIA